MSRFPCSFHQGKVLGKMAVGYWAWFNAHGERSAWKLRYCVECATTNLNWLFTAAQRMQTTQELFACISCGADCREDSDPMWLTLYVPNQDPREYELQLDGACAAKLRSPVVSFGEKLPDRSSQVRGPSSLTAAWDKLGLDPAT